MWTTTLVLVIAVALAFDFTNGFHDTANAVATSVSTRALSPQVAVLFAAVLNFVGAFVSLKVAATIAKGIVVQDEVTLKVIMAGLIGAITWNLTTWIVGLPSSSSHALIGGVAGAVFAAAGTDAVKWDGIKDKVLIPSLLAPFMGIVGAFLIVTLCTWLVARRRPGLVNTGFRRLQLISGGFVAFTHGTNDAQKTMGIMALALSSAGVLGKGADPPLWVVISAASAMALGTWAGGWRIIKTLGQHVTKLTPLQGFGAQTACATILWFTAHYGYPVSTTHTISGSVLGAGITKRLNAVRWGVAGNILVAWVLTIPCAAVVGMGMELVSRLPEGAGIVFGVGVAICIAFYAARRRQTAATPISAQIPPTPQVVGETA
jgi:PiT family inorganic phosphate transporter